MHLTPVSYTHLDVYKRQDPILWGNWTKNRHDEDGTMTLRTNNYLRDIREELLEERDNIIENNNNGNNGIVQILSLIHIWSFKTVI